MNIANTIYTQLGGSRFKQMTGSKDFVGIENGLRMRLSRNKIGAQYLTITLNGMDLYDMVFTKLVKTYDPELKKLGIKFEIEVQIKTIKTFEDVYFDELEERFTEATGLYTRL